MPIATGIAAFGTLLKRGDGQASESFATVQEVSNIDLSGLKVGTVDITNHSSPSRFKEITPTTIDPGTIKVTANFLPASITQGYGTGLALDLASETKRNFQLWFTNITTPWTFAAYVTGMDIKAPVEGKLEVDFTLDITGVIGFTYV